MLALRATLIASNEDRYRGAMGLFTPSIESLVDSGDLRGLVRRLDQKDKDHASQALVGVGAAAVPALIEALGTGRGKAATDVLAEIGVPALPLLVGLISGGDETKVVQAGGVIRSMRERDVSLPSEVVAPLVQITQDGQGVSERRRFAALNALGLLSYSDGGELPLPGQEEAPLRTLTGHTGWVNGCALSPDGSWIVSASGDQTLKVWDTASGECLRTLAGHTNWVFGCAVSPDGTWIVSAGGDRTLKVWDATSGTCLRTLHGHGSWVNGCAVSPDGTWIVSASGDRYLKVWDAASGDCLHTLDGHLNSATWCAVSADGTWILSASRDRDLKVWDAASGDCLRTLSDHTDRIEGCAISPDGRRVVSASWDKTVKVWDTQSWRVEG